MIQLFKSNNPATVFLLVLLALLLHLPHLLHPQAHQIVSTDIGGYYLMQITNAPLQNNLLLGEIILLVLIIAQALLWNTFLSNVRFLPYQNFLPAFVFIVFSSVLPDFNRLSPVFFTTFILIWMLYKLNNIYRKEKQTGATFDLGFAVGVAALLAAHNIFLSLFGIFGLAILRPTSFKEWLNFLIGIFIPFFLVGTWWFYTDRFFQFEESIVGNLIFHKNQSTLYNNGFWVVSGVTILMIVSIYFILSTRQLSRLVLIRKFFNVLFHLCWITSFMWFFSTDRSWAVFYLLAIPLSFYFAYYLCIEKKTWKADLWMGIWIAAILFSQYFNQFKIF